MANVTVTTAAVFIPEVWSDDILRVVEANLIIGPRVHNYSSDVEKCGDIIHVPAITEIAATAKTAGTDVTFTANTESEVQIAIDQHWYAAVKIEDIAQAQAKANLRSEYTNTIGYSIAKKMDATLAALAAGFSQTTGTTNTAITDAVILSSIQYLDEANAPFTDRHFVIKPAAKKDILSLDKFVLFQNTGAVNGSSRVLNGQLGEVYGVEVGVTTQITQSASPVTNQNMMFHRDAIGLATQESVRVQSQYAIQSLAWQVVADAIWGVKEMRDTFGVLVKS
jgi:hypothetical protein